MNHILIKLWLRLYRGMLYLYPPEHRITYGELMLNTADAMLHDALIQGGWWRLLSVMGRLLFDTAVNLPREYTYEYRAQWMKWRERLPMLVGLASFILISLPLLPLLGTFQLFSWVLGPIPLLVVVWKRAMPDVSNTVWKGIILMLLLGPALRVVELASLSHPFDNLRVLSVIWGSMGNGSVFLCLILLVRSLAQTTGIPALPASAALLAVLARYADLDYFTFDMSVWIRTLPLVAIPVMWVWWQVVRNNRLRKTGLVALWALTLTAVVAMNVYGRYEFGGTDYYSMYPVAYSVVSVAVLWIAAELPDKRRKPEMVSSQAGYTA